MCGEAYRVLESGRSFLEAAANLTVEVIDVVVVVGCGVIQDLRHRVKRQHIEGVSSCVGLRKHVNWCLGLKSIYC